MCHHPLVPKVVSLLRRLGLAGLLAPAVLVVPSRCTPAQARRAPARSATAQTAQTASVTAKLEVLSRIQAAAVQSGDPAAIALASRDLNAELLSLLGTLKIAQNLPDEAAMLYRSSLDFHESGDLRLRLASLLLRSGHPADAAPEARKVTEAEPRNSAAWTSLGSALRTGGKEKEAVDALTHALQLNSDVSTAYALASALLAVHEKNKADQIFRHILAAAGDTPIWHVAIGDAYREADYKPEAAEEFRMALARDPHVLHGEFFLGLVNLQMNQWGPNSESFLHLRKAVQQSPHDYVSNFYLGALEATDGSDLAASNRHLKAAAEADPTQPEVWIYLGQNANREKSFADAKTYLRKAITLTGTDEARNDYQVRRAYFTLGRLLIADGDRAAGQKLLADYKRTEQAAVAQAAVSIGPGQQTSDAHTTETPSSDAHSPNEPAGNALSSLSVKPSTAVSSAVPANDLPEPQAKALRSAESQLRTLLASSYNDLGTAEARQQQYAPALQSFQQAEQWDTPTPALLHNIGLAAYRTGNSAEVDRALTKYFAANPAPNDPRARVTLAMAQFDLGHFANASKNFTAAGGLATTDPRTAYTYAFSLARDGHAQEANALADKLQAAPLPPDVLSLVCHLYFDAENYNGSNTCYGKLTAQAPTLPQAHYFVGESLIKLDRPADAIPELRQELTLSPGEPNVNAALAFALLQTSHKDEARILLEQTVAAHPDHAESQYELGKLLLENGDAVNAVPHLESSAKTDGSKDYVHYQLATAYRKANRSADAEREFKTYREIKDKHRNDQAIPQAQQQPPPA